MEFLILGFLTGLSLILVIGAQNIFVLEQGLKKQYIFLVCLICSLSDLILIFLGIFLFEFYKNLFTHKIELIFNILLFIFLIYFVISKIRTNYDNFDINTYKTEISLKNVIIKTLGFTYLNPHVYSDTVFFLGNFSKSFLIIQKYYFGIGASVASFLFFFFLGYLSKFSSNYLKSKKTWRIINLFIILFMSILAFYVLLDILNFKLSYFSK